MSIATSWISRLKPAVKPGSRAALRTGRSYRAPQAGQTIALHTGSPAEPVLAAWGITTNGKPAFIGLAPGTGESADAWAAFLTDLRDRGLASPLLVISDGAPA